MHDLVKYSEAFAAKLQNEYESLVADRHTTREILESRKVELTKMRDDELRRLEQFYQQQKSMVSGIFAALLGEVDADLTKNAEGLKRLTDESDDGGKPRKGGGGGPQAIAAE